MGSFYVIKFNKVCSFRPSAHQHASILSSTSTAMVIDIRIRSNSLKPTDEQLDGVTVARYLVTIKVNGRMVLIVDGGNHGVTW